MTVIYLYPLLSSNSVPRESLRPRVNEDCLCDTGGHECFLMRPIVLTLGNPHNAEHVLNEAGLARLGKSPRVRSGCCLLLLLEEPPLRSQKLTLGTSCASPKFILVPKPDACRRDVDPIKNILEIMHSLQGLVC